jgi:predicted nucleotidyltransferase
MQAIEKLMHNILNVIQEKIKELEQTHAIRILFACESGSRAWGFPSTDSDYDVRFIYVHQKEWYLSIHEKRDVVELPVNKELDINGWDLRKALRLLSKHNAVLFEWIQSPIVYSARVGFIKEFNEIAGPCFSPIAGLHHYLNSAKKHYADCINTDRVKLKRYFYCLRSTLAGLWIVRYKTIPPMELNQLLPIVREKQALVKTIDELVQLKALKDETYLHSRNAKLEEFLKEGIALCENAASSLPSSSPDQESLNAFLRSMIEGLDGH